MNLMVVDFRAYKQEIAECAERGIEPDDISSDLTCKFLALFYMTNADEKQVKIILDNIYANWVLNKKEHEDDSSDGEV